MESHAELAARGLLLHQQGDLEGARRLYLRALELETSFDALHWMGVLDLQAGNAKFAVQWLTKATDINQADAQAYANLAHAHAALLDFGLAHKAFEASLALHPESPETLAGLGNLHLTQRQFEEAARCYEQALRLNESLIDVWRNWASALSSMGEYTLALAKLDYAEQLVVSFAQPLSIPLTLERGNLFVRMGKFDDALESFKRVTISAPQFAHGHMSLGNVYRELDQGDEALQCYQQARKLQPENNDVLHSMALLKQDQGDMEAAKAIFQQILDVEPAHGPANRLLASLIRFSTEDSGILRLRKALETPNLANEHRKHLHFALGKALEDTETYEESFVHYERGNALHREGIRYSIERDEKEMQILQNSFGRSFFDHEVRRVWNQRKTIPIFIVGMPRSGTSLIEQILASHPEVHGAGELSEFDQSLDEVLPSNGYASDESYLPKEEQLSEQRRVQALAQMNERQLREVGERYLQRVEALTSCRWIVDKMPANFRHIALIRAALRDAVIIHSQRHPLGTCWSMFKHFLGAKGHAYSFTLREIGRYYLAYWRLMQHWHTLDSSLLSVRYEDMVADQERTMRKLIADCGLPWSDACAEFYTTQRPVKTLSAAQVRRPIYSDATVQWRHFSAQLAPLTQRLGNVIELYSTTTDNG